MNVLVTGSKGFLGLNLCLWLRNSGHKVLEIDKHNVNQLEDYIKQSDFIVHLAASNRPTNIQEFYDVNVNFTKRLVDSVCSINKNIPIIFSSSIKVSTDSDYGRSKKQAEDYLLQSGLKTYIFRLSNLFGKWCKPNYNSVVATFCYNISRNLPIKFSDENNVVGLVYVDDVCRTIINIINRRKKIMSNNKYEIKPIYKITLKKLANILYKFKNDRVLSLIPNQKNAFIKKLYSTYLSYLPENELSYFLKKNTDERGSFTEFTKSDEGGQTSINVINPHVTKGNHFHHTKNEKFLVVSGECLIRLRRIGSQDIIEYKTSGEKLEVVDIPAGYTHNITNIGKNPSIVVIWCNERFSKENPDTYLEIV